MPDRPPAADAATLPIRTGSGYPPPHDEPCRERSRAALGEAFGLGQFGVNLLRLPPGAWSSQRHWHSHEDEFVYVLEGNPVLVDDNGETQLAPGMCAGFPAGASNGHHIVNRSDHMVVMLEVGGRSEADAVDYPDIDLRVTATGPFTRKDGTPV